MNECLVGSLVGSSGELRTAELLANIFIILIYSNVDKIPTHVEKTQALSPNDWLDMIGFLTFPLPSSPCTANGMRVPAISSKSSLVNASKDG